jgi:hypothetical protein
MPADVDVYEDCVLLPRWHLDSASSGGEEYCVLTWQKGKTELRSLIPFKRKELS